MKDLIYLLIGLIFLGLGILTIVSYSKKTNRFREEGFEVVGTISKISGRREHRKAFVSYTVAGQDFMVQLDHYSNSMRVGDTIRLYVDRNNPNVFVSDTKTPISMGGLFVVIGVGLIIVGLFKVFG